MGKQELFEIPKGILPPSLHFSLLSYQSLSYSTEWFKDSDDHNILSFYELLFVFSAQ